MICKASDSTDKRFIGKLLGVIAIIFCVLIVCISVYSFSKPFDFSPPGRKQTGKAITNVFIVKNDAYYLRRDGCLYMCSDGEDIFVHLFPTYMVYWSEDMDGFVYYDNNAICIYYPLDDSVIPYTNVDTPIEKHDLCYVLFTSEKNIYLKCGANNYIVSKKTQEINTIHFPIENCIYTNRLYSVFFSSDYQRVFILDFETNTEKEILYEVSNLPILSACLVGNTLYYVRSDGRLKCCNINDPKGYPTQAGVDMGVENNVLSVSPSGESLLCVVGESQNDIIATAIIELSPDGNTRQILKVGKPYYYIPGSCRFAVNDNMYIFAVTTDSVVVHGQVNLTDP